MELSSQFNNVVADRAMGSVYDINARIQGASPILQGLSAGMYPIIMEYLNFVNSFKMPNLKNVRVLDSIEDIVRSFFIRSHVYEDKGYDSEFGNNGLEFDSYDAQSVSFGYEKDGNLIASLRMVCDGKGGLPSEKYCPKISDIKQSYRVIEGSRTVILPEFQKSNGVLVQLLMACKQFAELNGFEKVLYCSERPVFDMYDKSFAKQDLVDENVVYGNVEAPLVLATWSPSDVYGKFEKMYNRFERLN